MMENRQTKKHVGRQPAYPFQKSQVRLFLIGLGVLTAGFVALSQGPWNSLLSLTIAPILLVTAYVVLIPLSILKRDKD
jgi:hypothetical protein